MQPVPRPAQAVVLHYRSRAVAPLRPLDAEDAELLRIISDPCTPVFLTVHAGGRRRYSYWQPFDAHTGRGSCYVALPTEACDILRSTGRITLGEPLVEPSRTIYRIRLADTLTAPQRPVRATAHAA
ncbi:hypothetical protein C1I97_04685 [Streptomyces sp. NTH33]|uniref:hypothetical protein n=1 Tax=Streptomyces sp. NTH33 TaxID=1735453 RepID=UPI000DA83722|nr:hypothetical protein [Streptomyces sp. NTH33]PZH17801.1 hypothetical protein C1I97_04685 [Streptomyces sp. NTH33]